MIRIRLLLAWCGLALVAAIVPKDYPEGMLICAALRTLLIMTQWRKFRAPGSAIPPEGPQDEVIPGTI